MTTLTQRRRRRRLEINIVPLVDVLIVLIFFFLMMMQFRDENVLNILPPEMETAGQNKALDSIVIAVDQEGQFYYNDQLVDEEELKSALETVSGISTNQTILIVADEDTPFKNITLIMDECRKNGLEALRVQTR